MIAEISEDSPDNVAGQLERLEEHIMGLGEFSREIKMNNIIEAYALSVPPKHKRLCKCTASW